MPAIKDSLRAIGDLTDRQTKDDRDDRPRIDKSATYQPSAQGAPRSSAQAVVIRCKASASSACEVA